MSQYRLYRWWWILGYYHILLPLQEAVIINGNKMLPQTHYLKKKLQTTNYKLTTCSAESWHICNTCNCAAKPDAVMPMFSKAIIFLTQMKFFPPHRGFSKGFIFKWPKILCLWGQENNLHLLKNMFKKYAEKQTPKAFIIYVLCNLELMHNIYFFVHTTAWLNSQIWLFVRCFSCLVVYKWDISKLLWIKVSTK